MKAKLHYFISLALSLLIGCMVGITFGSYSAAKASFSQIQPVADLNSGVVTIKLLNAAGGKLNGQVVGQNARIAYSANGILEIEKDETFELPINQISLGSYYASSSIPEGALFMASKSGKYFYSVFDKSAYRISEKNRLFFSSEEEASRAGFTKR